MRTAILIGLLGWAGIVFGQNADTYFHLGAQTFVTNDVEPAKEIVNEGLANYPEDPWLLGLKQLLEQQQQQQQQQDQQSSEQNQENSDQNQSLDSSVKQPDQNPRPEEEPQQEQRPPQEEQAPPPGEEEQQQPEKAGEMTEDEANMLLDALKQREQAEREALMQQQIQRQNRQTAPVEKDW